MPCLVSVKGVLVMADSTDDKNDEFIVDGVVKFYIDGKYAIISPNDVRLTEILVRESLIEKSGYRNIVGGMRINLKVVIHKERLRATEILELRHQDDSSHLPWDLGVIVDFDPIRGFGWVEIGKRFQVFIHSKEMREAGLRHLRNGATVEIQWEQIKAGPTVNRVRLPLK
jgi:cold shock CspA family protein